MTKRHYILLELYMTLMILNFFNTKVEKFLAKNHYILLELHMTLINLYRQQNSHFGNMMNNKLVSVSTPRLNAKKTSMAIAKTPWQCQLSI
jgi:hypothetical protein